jgi:hypothetical protein
MRVGGQRHVPAALPPGKRPGTHSTGHLMGPRAGLDSCEQSRPHRVSIPDRPARWVSLYRLSYRGPLYTTVIRQIVHTKAGTPLVRTNSVKRTATACTQC